MRHSAGSYSLPARYMAQLVDYLESAGIDRVAVLRAAGVRSIEGPNARLSLQQVESLLRAAEQASGRLDLGFELGRRELRAQLPQADWQDTRLTAVDVALAAVTAGSKSLPSLGPGDPDTAASNVCPGLGMLTKTGRGP